jgi:hypothetical protein
MPPQHLHNSVLSAALLLSELLCITTDSSPLPQNFSSMCAGDASVVVSKLTLKKHNYTHFSASTWQQIATTTKYYEVLRYFVLRYCTTLFRRVSTYTSRTVPAATKRLVFPNIVA